MDITDTELDSLFSFEKHFADIAPAPTLVSILGTTVQRYSYEVELGEIDVLGARLPVDRASRRHRGGPPHPDQGPRGVPRERRPAGRSGEPQADLRRGLHRPLRRPGRLARRQRERPRDADRGLERHARRPRPLAQGQRDADRRPQHPRRRPDRSSDTSAADLQDVQGGSIDLTATKGSIGTEADFLETNLDEAAATDGLLDATAQLGAYLWEVEGDLRVGTVWAKQTGNPGTTDAALVSENGSILDAADDAEADVIAHRIDLKAAGSIGILEQRSRDQLRDERARRRRTAIRRGDPRRRDRRDEARADSPRRALARRQRPAHRCPTPTLRAVRRSRPRLLRRKPRSPRSTSSRRT